MRLAVATLFPLLLAGADLDQLRKLDETKRLFDLRRALTETAASEPETAYYRARVHARFGQEQIAITEFREFLNTGPAEMMHRKVHQEMADAYTRLGQYRDAAAEWTALLGLIPPDDPERAEIEEGLSMWESLGDVAAQSVEFGGNVLVQARYDLLTRSIPLLVNGTKADWILDTGANLSIVSESEAKRLGLDVRNSSVHGSSGHTGKQFSTRPAVASEIRVGSARLHNVIVMVIPDHAMHFGPLGLKHLAGILGLPAIRALGSVEISANGEMRIEPGPPKTTGKPNICFNELSPIVQVYHAGRPVSMALDTGGNVSYLYPSFRDFMTPEELKELGRRRDRSNGVGGSITLESDLVRAIQFELPGKTVLLKNISLRRASTPAFDGYTEGLLGMDAMNGGFTLDFRAMQLRLD